MSLQQLFDVNCYFNFFRAVSGSDRKGKGIKKNGLQIDVFYTNHVLNSHRSTALIATKRSLVPAISHKCRLQHHPPKCS